MRDLDFAARAPASARAGRRERRRQDHAREAAGAPLRPDEGRILLDGVDLRDYDLDELRASVGVIFQDFVRYDLTARENIAVGRIEARGRPRRASQRPPSGASPTTSIARLPRRLRPDARPALRRRRRPLGRRVAEDRARPRLHARRPGADPRRADRGARRARRVRGLPALRRAHAPARRAADLAPLLDRPHGRPHPRARRRADRSRGTHDELVAAGGRYAELFDLQAAGYR